MLTGGRLYLSPLSQPQRVLDLGTGTGMLQESDPDVTQADES